MGGEVKESPTPTTHQEEEVPFPRMGSAELCHTPEVPFPRMGSADLCHTPEVPFPRMVAADLCHGLTD